MNAEITSSHWLATVESVSCIAAAFACLFLAYKFVSRNRPTLQIVTIVFVALGLLVLRPSGVTLFLRSIALSAINAVGAKLTELETQIVNTRAELQRQAANFTTGIQDLQRTNELNQVKISSQLATVISMQQELSELQTNITAHQKKIENVEFLVDNLFSKYVTERISGADTNRVYFNCTNGVCTVVLLLADIPVKNSVRLYLLGQEAETEVGSCENAVWCILVGWDIKSTLFSISYVKDTRFRNRIKNVKMVSDTLFYLDSTPVAVHRR